jgi:hypothetical protein
MFNSLKIKLHAATRVFQKKPKPEFVNPYTPKITEPNSKINPYVTDYGTKKKKSVEELILERVIQKRESKDGIRETEYHTLPVTPTDPTFFHDMKEMFIGDLLFVATKFPNRIKKEKAMSSDEILRACENTKWQ